MSLFWSRCPRDVVMVHGPDALTYLDSQVSQDLKPLAVGQAVASLVLEPNGRVDALVRVLRSGDHAYVLDVDAGWGEALVARLNRFRIRVEAEVEPISWSVVAVRGDGAASLPPSPGAVTVAAWWGDDSSVDLMGPAPAPPAGIPEGDPAALAAARISAGWPAMGSEIVEDTIPAETGVIDLAVSFTKGCYPGQELVERMNSRGARAPRRLVRIGLTAPAAPGDPVTNPDGHVGVVTSVVGDRALGHVRRSVTVPGRGAVNDAEATLESLR